MRWWIYLSRGLPGCAHRDREYTVVVENTLPIRPDVAEDICSETTVANQYPRISILSDANALYLLATSEFCASRVVCYLLPAPLNLCNRETVLGDSFFITRELITWFVCIIAPLLSRMPYHQTVGNNITSEFVIRSRCAAILNISFVSYECVHEYTLISFSTLLGCVFEKNK